VSVKVVAVLHPFKSTRIIKHVEKQSLRDMYLSFHPPFGIEFARFQVDGVPVEDVAIVPDDGSEVVIKVVPAGTKGAGTASKVAGVALVLAGIAVGVSLGWTVVGTGVAVALIGTGVSLFAGGVVLYNLNIPGGYTTPSTPATTQSPGISGSRNRYVTAGGTPIVLGRHLISPDHGALPYTNAEGIEWAEFDPSLAELKGEPSQYLTQLFVIGQSDLEIETDSYKIADTSLSSYKGITGPEIKTDGSVSSLYPYIVKETSLSNRELKNKNAEGSYDYAVVTTPTRTRRIIVEIVFPNGLVRYNNNGQENYSDITIRAFYKKHGEPDTEYKSLGSWHPGVSVEGSGYKFTGKSTKTLRAAITKDLDNADSSGVDWIASQQYDVQLWRVTVDAEDSAFADDYKIIDKAYWNSLKAVRFERPISLAAQSKLTMAALHIRATDQLNNIIDQFNLVAKTKIRDYSGSGSGPSAWTLAVSSNPASLFAYVLTSDRISPRPVLDTKIDWPALEDWHAFCAEHGYACNAVVTSEMTRDQLLEAICSTARASWDKTIDGKYTVIVDKEQPAAVQLFTPRNSRDFQGTKVFPDIPHALKMKFVSANLAFQEDEVIVYDDGYNADGSDGRKAATKFQEVQLWGVTDPAQAWKIGRYQLAVTHLRSESFQITVGLEHLVCGRGSRIRFSHDVPMIGLGEARVKELAVNEYGLAYSIVCDSRLTMETGKSYAIEIRRSDGSLLSVPVVTAPGETDTFEFVTAIATTQIAVGDLFSFGEAGLVTHDCIISALDPTGDLSKRLTLVPYAPEIFALVDDPELEIPAYDPKISIPGDFTAPVRIASLYNPENDIRGAVKDLAKRPTYGDLTNPDTVIGAGNSIGDKTPPTAPELLSVSANEDCTISVTWYTSTDTESGVSHYNIYRKLSGDPTSLFIGRVSHVEQGERLYRDETTPHGRTYTYFVTAVDARGNESAPSELSVEVTAHDGRKPVAVSSLTAIAGKDYVELSWPAVTGTMVYQAAKTYVLERQVDGGSWETVEVPETTYRWTWTRPADGYPEKADPPTGEKLLSVFLFRIKAKNIYGTVSESYTPTAAGAAPSTDSYLTWIPGKPSIYGRASGRTAIVSWPEQPSLYGFLRYEIQIQKGESGSWYAPARTKDPYGDESLNPWRESDTEGGSYSLPIEEWNQTLPLDGQDAGLPEDTVYQFRVRQVVAVPQAADDADHGVYATSDGKRAGEWSDPLTIAAKATSAKDVVTHAITEAHLADEAVSERAIAAGSVTAEKIAVESLAAISANLGVVEDGALSADAFSLNYWVLANDVVSGRVAGDVRFGNAENYIKFEASSGDLIFNVTTFRVSSVATRLKGTLEVSDAGSVSDGLTNPISIFASGDGAAKIGVLNQLNGFSVRVNGTEKLKVTSAGIETAEVLADTLKVSSGIEAAQIGVASDTDLLQLASAALTINGNITSKGAVTTLGAGTFSYPSTPTDSSTCTVIFKGNGADARFTINDGSGNLNFRHLSYLYSDWNDKYQLDSTGCIRMTSSSGSLSIMHGSGGTAGATVSYVTSISISNAGVVSISDDVDRTTYIGRAAVGYGGGYSDYAYFGHRDLVGSAGNYAILQNSSGDTLINAASGRAMYFRCGNADFAYYTPQTRFVVTYANSTANASALLIASSGSQAVLGFSASNSFAGYIRGDSGGNLCFVPSASAYIGYSGENWGMIISASTGYITAPGVFNQASLSGRYVGVTSGGALYSVTSSIKYKTDIEDIQDSFYDKVFDLRPVWFRSKNALDNPAWSWFGLIAEEVAKIEPRLVQYDLRKDGTLEPEGVAYLSLPVLLLGAFKKYKRDQENIITALNKRIDELVTAKM